MILSLSYLDLKLDDPIYGKKKIYTNDLRRLGQRLRFLVEKFGYGIIGMIPLPSNEPTLLQALNLTNEAILQIPLKKFEPFVDYLDSMFGNILCKTSKALSDIVEAIFNKEIDHPDEFANERCEQAQIIQYLRGSPKLLQLIS